MRSEIQLRWSTPFPTARRNPMHDSMPTEHLERPRPQIRRFVSLLVIGVATAQILGFTLKVPSMLEVNDISRWCTVWSLLERGTYEINDCPWQHRTQDKVKRPNKLKAPAPGASWLNRVEYQLALRSWKEGPVE